MDEFYYAKTKPAKCPACGSSKVAAILYGLPIVDDEFEKLVEEGEIVCGGCMVSDFDPGWRCKECSVKIYHEEDRDKEPRPNE